jgi:hypothetical protein
MSSGGEAGRVHARDASATTTPAGGRAGGVGTTPSSLLGGGPASGGPGSTSVAALSVAAPSLTGAGASGGRVLGVAGPISLDDGGVACPPPGTGGAVVGAGGGAEAGATVPTSENRSVGSGAEQAASAKSQETTPKQPPRAPPRAVKQRAWTAPMPVPMRATVVPRIVRSDRYLVCANCALVDNARRSADTGRGIFVAGLRPARPSARACRGLERRRSMRAEVQRC